jgi:hypothetical protein
LKKKTNYFFHFLCHEEPSFGGKEREKKNFLFLGNEIQILTGAETK